MIPSVTGMCEWVWEAVIFGVYVVVIMWKGCGAVGSGCGRWTVRGMAVSKISDGVLWVNGSIAAWDLDKWRRLVVGLSDIVVGIMCGEIQGVGGRFRVLGGA